MENESQPEEQQMGEDIVTEEGAIQQFSPFSPPFLESSRVTTPSFNDPMFPLGIETGGLIAMMARFMEEIWTL